MKGPSIWAGLLLLGAVILTDGIRLAHAQVAAQSRALMSRAQPLVPPEAKETQAPPAIRRLGGLKERARSLAATLDVAVTVFESPGGLVCLRAGDPGGPTVVVIPPVDDDGFAGRGPAEASGTPDATAVDLRLRQAMDGAATAIMEAARGEAGLKSLGRASVTVILGPGKRLAAALEARTSVQQETAFDLNFPWRWDEARAIRGRSAGPYPASRPDVLALSDFLLGEGRIASVLRSTRSLGPQSSPASLAAFVKGRLKLEHRSPKADGALGAEMNAALAGLPDLRFSKPVWRRLGAHSWVVDLKLENHGLCPTGPSHGPAVELRLPKGIELGVQVRGESYRWLACGAAPEAPVALQDRAIRSDKARLPSLGPGEALRVRLVLGADDSAVRAHPVLDITASSGRALAAAMVGLTPPAGSR